MNSTSTKSTVELSQDANIHIALSTEWKIFICVLAALVINVVCLLFLCVTKYRKRTNDAKSASFINPSRKTFWPNFPIWNLADSHLCVENSRKTNSNYKDNLISHGLFPPGGKRIYKGKDVMYQNLLEDV